jgi:hypothetical protein
MSLQSQIQEKENEISELYSQIKKIKFDFISTFSNLSECLLINVNVDIFTYRSEETEVNFNISDKVSGDEIVFKITFNNEIRTSTSFSYLKTKNFEALNTVAEMISFIQSLEHNINEDAKQLFIVLNEEIDTINQLISLKKEEERYLLEETYIIKERKIREILTPIKEKEISKIHRYFTEHYHGDTHTKKYITLERNFDTFSFKETSVTANNKNKLSLMFENSQTSKSRLKEQLKEIITIKDNILNNYDDLANIGLIKEEKKWRLEISANDLYNHLKAQINANNF